MTRREYFATLLGSGTPRGTTEEIKWVGEFIRRVGGLRWAGYRDSLAWGRLLALCRENEDLRLAVGAAAIRKIRRFSGARATSEVGSTWLHGDPGVPDEPTGPLVYLLWS